MEERPVKVVRVRPVEFIDGIDFAHAPRLLGFAKEKAKTGSETILQLDSGEPLLVRWQYGLGRVVAFMSDAKARWSADWVNWKSYGTLWPQMVRDVSHRDRTVRAGVRRGSHEGESIVYYDVMGDAETGLTAKNGAPAPSPLRQVFHHRCPRKSWSTRREKLRTPCRSKKPRRDITKRAYRIISADCITSLQEIPSWRCPKPAFIASRKK